ncbi:protein C12orf4 homolog [Lethenteron reissneri]|uniref:protein C12orf4 homolog n=1 Tax=Lethenteron reissneri TaxID=7753 RepID=UPI002AB70244|nr:protein C12orf4 homolog [Lethenteron reissneri]
MWVGYTSAAMGEDVPGPVAVVDFTFATRDTPPLSVPVGLPLACPISDLHSRLVHSHALPCYAEDELWKALGEFVRDKTQELYDQSGERALEGIALASDEEVDGLARAWEKAFRETTVEHVGAEEARVDEEFSRAYSALIHSPVSHTLLTLEHHYCVSAAEMLAEREMALQQLRERQRVEMERAMQELGKSLRDEDVNVLAVQHFETQQAVESKWNVELKQLMELQRLEYRDWVMKVHQDSSTPDGKAGGDDVAGLTGQPPDAEMEEGVAYEEHRRLEESFTIHLGAQMKTMHNLRLLRADVLELCRLRAGSQGDTRPRRLHMALSLYSAALSGLVLLVDNRISSYSGIKKEFATVCQQSTDFHFLELEQQMNDVQEVVLAVNTFHGKDKKGTESFARNGGADDKKNSEKNPQNISPGEFYITRHSNLAEVQVVFHLCVDDGARCGAITARDPAIMGLRNILKVCCHNDITNITLPLLLVHEMSEEMTVSWCLKKAELVFKCVKGFMMEMASWDGGVSRTVQFIVPQGLSEEVFFQLSAMLPQIFRVSSALTLTSSRQK